MSDDARFGLTAISMLGSVFSPYYKRARARGDADPLAFSAANVALYTPSGDAWALTEVPSARRSARALEIAGSRFAWTDRGLSFTFSERTSPWRRPLAGEVEVTFDRAHGVPVAIDRAGRHTWWPIVPHARATVSVPTHGARFSGSAYVDANRGCEGLEERIDAWSWSRVATGERTVITYDVCERDADPRVATFAFDRDARPVDPPVLARRDVAVTRWGVRRPHRAAGDVRLVRTLEDTPFYARSLIEERVDGQIARGVHESLDLCRFRRGWVQHLLGYRMSRSDR